MSRPSTFTPPPLVCASLNRLSPDERTAHWVGFCVALDYALDAADLVGPSRGAPRIALARQVAMYICNVEFGLSYDCIASVYRRDRSTVAHACRVIEDEREDRWLNCRVAALEVICRESLDLVHRPELLLGEGVQ